MSERIDRSLFRLLVMLLCTAAVFAGSACLAFAEGEDDMDIALTEGDVLKGFAEEGVVYKSDDPSIAWVDSKGKLNAMKEGETTITAEKEGEPDKVYTVKVADYTDGTEIVGRLKILARYNDSMDFYDGHSYLLFTSYQDGVDITVDDLYGGYEISEEYYSDIYHDISNGSNHTGSDAEKYFTFREGMKTMRLDRGEIVTIGMYRGFDLTVPQAALGSLKNSTVWTQLKKAGKTAAVKAVFKFLEDGSLPQEDAIAELIAIFKDAGVDYEKWLDGVVEGGVCFNRELYNQKLEWDQYENVTYEMDITRKQLDTLVAYLGGNLNHFNILKNSCATVALRAWNAGVGTTEDGEHNAYWLSAKGEGVYEYIDAPKGVRDAIRDRLPGYYLNNSQGVAEPDAGYQDDTGWVYVSAPEPVDPVIYSYADDSTIIEWTRTKIASLVNAAKDGVVIPYDKDRQLIDVVINSTAEGDVTTIESIDFNINGTTVTAGAGKMPETGAWFSVKVADPPEGEEYYVTDKDGNVLPNEYDDGWVTFYAETLPVSYKIISSAEGAHNIIRTQVVKPDDLEAEAEIYYHDADGSKKTVGEQEEVKAGTRIFVKPVFKALDFDSVLTGITMNGEDIMSEEDFDAEEKAYFVDMPLKYSRLKVFFDKGTANAKEKDTLQISVNDELDVADYVEVLTGEKEEPSDQIKWYVLYDVDGALELDRSGRVLSARKPGNAYIWAASASNSNVGVLYTVEVYENVKEMPQVIFNENSEDFSIVREGDEEYDRLPFSGYRVPAGTVLTVDLHQTESKVAAAVTANDSEVAPGGKITVNGNTLINVVFAKAVIKGVPKEAALSKKGDTLKLDAKVAYSGLPSVVSVYDKSITFESSDPLVTVDDTGLVTVAEDVPETGKEVIVTAYAGSSNRQVFAECKVNVGNYVGARIVGRLTIYARPIKKMQLVAHSSATFMSYDDIDLNVSSYGYYKPTDKLKTLLQDYDDHPEKYKADPSLYNDNEPEISDRRSYFEETHNGAGSEPQTISLKAGESISVSNYGYDINNLVCVLKAFENGDIANTESAKALIEQAHLYMENSDEYDGEKAFDSMVETLMQAYMMVSTTGYNPVNGQSEGGIDVNREMYNQFVRNEPQTPNYYYTIEITADELAHLQKYLADPENNYYSVFVKNCTTGAIDVWNSTLFDKPELQLKANYSGFCADPESLYIELGLLGKKTELDGEGGQNYYPRVLRDRNALALTDQNNISINSSLKVTQTGSKVTVKYGKVPAAAEYKVYASYCGKKMSLIKTLTGNSMSFSKLNGKKLNLKKNMKVQVVAVNSRGTVIARSLEAHIIGRKNKKYTNPKSIKLSKSSYTIKQGKTAKIKAKTVLVSKKKKDLTSKHAAKFRYASTDKLVATVSKKGVIKATGKGTCYIYVYARNGCPKKVKVTVK